METCEQMTCFEWCFTNRPELHNYTYCETVEECCREIERRYSCLESDYKVLKKQIRIVKQKKDMKYYSEVLYEEDIHMQRKENHAGKKGQRKFRSEQQDIAYQRCQAAEQPLLLLVK